MLTRRRLLTGLGAGALVVGFDPVGRRWVSAEEPAAGGFDRVPPLAGTLHLDLPTRRADSRDNGRIVERLPAAVLRPGSVEDIRQLVRFCRRHRIEVATRGQAHSTYGQGLVGGLIVESRSLARIHSIGSDHAVVDAGVTWRELTLAAYEHGLTPPVLTGYVGLSVGGTLSMGGISSTYGRGAQVDHVRRLEIVTGAGDLRRCSPAQDRDLFEAVLGGLGQYGVITAATVDLVPARPMVRTYLLNYADNATFFRELRTLLDRGELPDLFGQWFPGEEGLTYHINAAAYFDPADPPDDARLFRGLTAVPVARDLPFLDYVQRVDVLIERLRQTISWDDLVKPWFDVWLPDSRVERHVGDVIPTLTPRDVGAGGFMLLFPQRRARLTRPFLRLPEPDGSDWVYLFDILTASESPGPDPAFAAEITRRNNELFATARSAGGVRYPIGSIDFGPADWRAHYGALWPQVVRRKRRYDPDRILTPGFGIVW